MFNPAEIDKISMRNGAAVTHTVAMGNLLSTDQSTLYLDANSGFDAGRPITVFTVVTTRLGNAVTFKEVNPSAILSNFTVPRKLFGDAPFVLTAPTTNSDGAFTYSSSNLAVATVSGSTVTIVGTGSTTITATQAATATYASNSISTTLYTTPINFELDGITVKYIGNAANVPASSALFIQEDVRGTLEWFAVVKDGMKSAIYAYASGTNGPFIPSGQTVPVPFNNIVTTLMTDLSTTFISKTAFNQPIGSWDTANVTTMNNMFSAAFVFNQPIGSWNTAKVMDMNNMFQSASAFNQPIGAWNTAEVTTMNRLFVSANAFNQPIGSWNTANVTDMMYMFGSAYAFNQAINSWNTAKVTSMSNMFVFAVAFNQPIGSWNTANAVDMSYMFYQATAFNQNISAWNVALVANFAGFRTNSALVVANMPAAFYPAASLSGFSVPSKTVNDAPFALTAPTSNSNGAFTYSSSNPAVATISGSTVTIVGRGTTTITATQAATFNYNTNSITASLVIPVLSLTGNTIKYIGEPADVPSSSALFVQANFRGTNEWFAVVKDGMKDAISAYASGTNGPFIPSGQTVVPFNNIVTTLMTNFSDMFNNAGSFNEAVGSWDTSNVTNMKSMFHGNNYFNQSISDWDTSNVSNMANMFRSTSLVQPIGSWNTSKVTEMQFMFAYTPFNQPINYNSVTNAWNTANVTDMGYMFSAAASFNQNIGSWNTANTLYMAGMFIDATAFNQNISSWNVALVEQFQNFRTNSALTVANMPAAFYPAASLSGFSVPSKTVNDAPFALTAPTSNSNGAFTYSSSNPAVATISGSTVTIVGRGTTTITATQAATFNYNTNSITASLVIPVLSLTGNTIKYIGEPADVPSSSALFVQADVRGTGSEWFAVVKDGMKAAITAYTAGTNAPFIPSGQSVPVPFNNIVTTLMTALSSTFLNSTNFNQPIGSWDTANVSTMREIFKDARYFNQPIGSWNTANVTNMSGMFQRATNFNQPIGSWNTANVTDMQWMFFFASVFNQPIGSWNTANVVDMYVMFAYAPNFNQPIDNWNTTNVTTMSYMFQYATNFNQPVGSWNTANVSTMNSMFQSATVFNQDISSWNVALVTPVPPTDFRTNSALTVANMPAAFYPAASLSGFSVPSKTVNDAPFALTAPTSNSNGAFTYSSSNPAVATISGSTVTIVGTGTTTITATQAATATYASNSITATFTVTVPSLLSLDSNGETIKYNGNATDVPASSALFIQADPRGTGSEWFAVVKDGMKSAIQAYAEGTNAPFIPSGQTVPVPFNNIVTTLMTDMSYTFNAIPNFNHEINSWDTSNVKDMSGLFGGSPYFNRAISAWNVSEVTNMSSMFYNVFYFNQNISGWNTAKVTNMGSMFYNAYSFNNNISGWNVALVTNFANFRTDSALIDDYMPAAFLP